jgi:dTDP-4-dehydrorhamnose 3,5-epimerase
MIVEPTRIAGVMLIRPEPQHDDRGHFARLFDADIFASHGLPAVFNQASTSTNFRKSIVRGLHLQRPPHGEHKLVRVTTGAIYDVAVDGRAGSPTYGQWQAFELTAENQLQLFLPLGILHGFQTLTDLAVVDYRMAGQFHAPAQDGVMWNDPDLAISWPDPANAFTSERDKAQRRFRDFTPVVL